MFALYSVQPDAITAEPTLVGLSIGLELADVLADQVAVARQYHVPTLVRRAGGDGFWVQIKDAEPSTYVHRN